MMHWIILGLLLGNAHALISFEDAIFPELGVSGRALAMGNAFIAKVNDSASAFYNPAGLGSVRKSHIHFSNFHLEANSALLDGMAGGNILSTGSNAAKGFSLDGIRQILLGHRGEQTHSRLQVMPNMIFRHFTAGYLLSRRQIGKLDDGDNELFQYGERLDHGPYAALNISLFGGIIKFGGSYMLLNRNEVFGEIDPDTTLNIESGDYKKGTMPFMVYGARLTLPMVWLPTFAYAVHNPGEVAFTQTSSTGAPDTIKPNAIIGFSLSPQIGQRIHIHLEAGYKDLTGSYPEIDVIRKVTYGLEIDFARTFFIRYGYGDGYGSGGISLRTRRLEFDLTTYAVETGTPSFPFKDKGDRRYSLTVSSGLGI